MYRNAEEALRAENENLREELKEIKRKSEEVKEETKGNYNIIAGFITIFLILFFCGLYSLLFIFIEETIDAIALTAFSLMINFFITGPLNSEIKNLQKLANYLGNETTSQKTRLVLIGLTGGGTLFLIGQTFYGIYFLFKLIFSK